MNIFKTILIGSFVILSFAYAVESEVEIINEKFAFVNEIYHDSWALIIGINEYWHVDPLHYAVDDAVAVKEMFVEKFGFKEENIRLILNEDATKDKILQGFSDILTNAKDKDRVVVFYAGHGETYKLPSGGDMGYLIPVDGNLDNLYLSSIPMKSVYDIAEMSYAKHILYLVDACYGGLTLSTRGLSKIKTPEYLKRMTREKGRQVITAGGKGEQVIEKPEWGHSAFTRNLLKGLGDDMADENMDGIITGDELGGFIKNRVVVDVDGAHTPQKGRIGSEMGEFVFISETLDEQIADRSPGNEKMSDLESEMEELKKILQLQGTQRGNPNIVPRKGKSNPKSYNMKTASTMAWMFPGMGHYYSGRAGKGLFYTVLELGALAGVAATSAMYTEETENYNTAYSYWESNQDNPGVSQADNQTAVTNAFNAQLGAKVGLIGTGSLSAIVWIWNILDVKKSKSKNYSSHDPISVGLNSRGHIEARFSF